MSGRDIRTPADAQDFETSVSRAATPATEFNVTKGTTWNLVAITDRRYAGGRSGTKAYRVYFLGTTYSPTINPTTPAYRQAAARVGTVVTEIPSLGLGTVLTYQDMKNFGAPGFYFCTAVNQRGQEGAAEQMVAAPV